MRSWLVVLFFRWGAIGYANKYILLRIEVPRSMHPSSSIQINNYRVVSRDLVAYLVDIPMCKLHLFYS